MFLKLRLNLILFSTWFAVLSMQVPLAASESQTSVEQRKEIILGTIKCKLLPLIELNDEYEAHQRKLFYPY